MPLLADTRPLQETTLQGIEQAVMPLVVPGRPDNAIYVSGWFYQREDLPSHLPGMTHPVWWPIDAQVLRQVVFKELIVTTVYNPAHLFLALEQDGYTVSMNWPDEFRAAKQVGNQQLSLGGLTTYFRLIQHYLFSEPDIVKILRMTTEEQLRRTLDGAAGQINIDIQQRFGEPPRTPGDRANPHGE